MVLIRTGESDKLPIMAQKPNIVVDHEVSPADFSALAAERGISISPRMVQKLAANGHIRATGRRNGHLATGEPRVCWWIPVDDANFRRLAARPKCGWPKGRKKAKKQTAEKN